MLKLTVTIAALALGMEFAPALAQPVPPGALLPGALPPGALPPPDRLVIINRNNTGGDTNVVIPRGATGADTFTSNSAAGGNASRPELAVPNGSTGGGGGGTR